MLKIIKDYTLTNNEKEIDVTKNGKNFLAPRVQSSSVQLSRVQAYNRPNSMSPESSRVQRFSRPEYKCPVVQIQESEVQEFRVQTSRPYIQSPVFSVCLFKHCHSNLNVVYCNRFCNNVKNSLSWLFIQLTNYLTN